MSKIFPLTKKRAAYAENRKTNLLGTKLAHNASLEQRYATSLRRLVLQMTSETLREVKKLFKTETSKEFITQQKAQIAMDVRYSRTANTMDANIGSMARILMNALTDKFTKLFAIKSKLIVNNMLLGAEKTSTSAVHASLSKLSGGLSLKTGIVSPGYEDIVSAITAENVALIKSIPQKYLTDVTGSVMRSITQGQGLKDLVPEIQKYDGQTYRRAKNIALDQTRKAYNSINKDKLTTLGITHFKWIHTSGSVSPRESHLHILDGKTFSFENLIEEQTALGVPERDRGIPGYPQNCKCSFNPIIDLSE